MTGYQDPNNPMQPLRQPKKSWFARSWWWFLPLVIGGPIVLCCGGFGLMGYLGFNKAMEMIEDLPAYKDGISIMENNPEVVQELGTPITVPGVFDVMQQGGAVNLQQTGATQTFDARIPVSGPNGSGWLVIEADANASGTWEFDELYLDTDSGQTIDLMPSTPGGAVPHDHDGDGVPDH